MESTTTAPAAAPVTPAAPAASAVAPVTSAAPAALPASAPVVQGAGTLQEQPAAEAKPQPGFFENPTILIILAGIWLLFLLSWRSGKKRERAAREQREQELNGIVKGDKVVTIGRVHGVVVKTDEKTFTIKPDPNKDYTMTFDREALLRVLKKDGSTSESAGDLTQSANQQ